MKEKKLQELQIYEQNLQTIILQKQVLQAEMNEISNALKEIEKSKEASVYKIIGGIMIKENREDIAKELKEKKEILELRIKNFEKQEEILKKKFEELRKELLEDLKEREEKKK